MHSIKRTKPAKPHADFPLFPHATGRWAKNHRQEKQRLLRMEFATFLQAFIHLPA